MTLVSAAQTVPSSSTDRRPVVCHVIHALGVGGAEVLVDQMMRSLSDDYRCLVAVLDHVGEIGERLQQDGFQVEHLHRGAGIDHQCARRLNQLVQRENVSLLHTHQYTPFFQAMLSRGLFGQTPVLLTEHGRHYPDLPSWKRSLANRLLLRKQDRLIGVGGATRQALIDNEGLPADRVEVIYNGVDLEDLRTAPSGARAAIREEFGLADDDFVAVQVARLHELKDHQTALQAIHQARDSNPRMRLLVAGDGEERAAIEDTIARLDLQEHVLLAGTRSDVSSLLAAADAFLLTSISEGIPLTVIEAMAARLPVVCTSVGGLPEMIEDGVSGFLCDAGDARTLARRLVGLSESEELCRDVGLAGSATAASRFSLQTMLQSYRTLYQEMIPTRSRSSGQPA